MLIITTGNTIISQVNNDWEDIFIIEGNYYEIFWSILSLTERTIGWGIIPPTNAIIIQVSNDELNICDYSGVFWNIMVNRRRICGVIIPTGHVIMYMVINDREDMCDYSRHLCWNVLLTF